MSSIHLIDGSQLSLIRVRHRVGIAWVSMLMAAAAIACVMIAWLLFGIINDAFGYVLVSYEMAPPTGIEEYDEAALAGLIRTDAGAGIVRRYEQEGALEDLPRPRLREIAETHVFQPSVLDTWSLSESLLRTAHIRGRLDETEGTALRFRAWIRPSFLTQPLERRPLTTGIRTALLGTVWIVTVSLAIAFPIGVATAVFLTEYDRGGWFSRFVRSNIETMASIPSIIYGILGLALFVRSLGPITSGAAFGVEGTGTVGRTVLSAALTLAILVLPSIVINSRDILERVPRSYREACYAVGASRSAVVVRRVLPAVSGQLITVLFLGISRVIGETAPLLVVGAAAFISVDPQGVFSRFTALPAQVFYWSARPGLEYQRLAAAAIIVLLVLSTTINLGLRALGRHLDRRSSVGVEERETGERNAR